MILCYFHIGLGFSACLAAYVLFNRGNIGKLFFFRSELALLFFPALRVSSRIDNIASYVLKAMPGLLYIFIITVRLAF